MNSTDSGCAVKIAVRERPLREMFKNNGVPPSAINYHSSNSNILIVDERPFAFDHVLPPSVSQEELFDFLVMPLVGKVIQGFHCTALAYGQTGTGKSYTMGLNPESLEGINVGMIPRCIQAILDSRGQDELDKKEISASFIEIYSEKVFDLLCETPSEPIIARGYKFTGGTKKPIKTIQDGYNLLHQGTKNRHVRPTKMNAQSSRSHAIFTIYVRNENQNKITQSCLNLVDLAGSEGVRRTGHQGVALSEGVHINQGLLSIGKVLQAITHGCKVIPYRDSVLSSVLQDSLNPNSYFTLLACISPHREDLSETLSTIRFAQNAKNLKNNPQINSKLMDLKRSKTPYKCNALRPKNTLATPTPCKRPFSLASFRPSGEKINPTVHGNTFCTPNKKRKTENIILNRTVVGLTPKEKQKIGTVKMPISKVVPFSYEPSVRESINPDEFDLDLDSRTSLTGLNISSSTTIDAPPQTNKASSTYSPIVRKCMAEFESTFMSQFLETLKKTQSVPKPSLFNSSPLEQERMRTIIRQELISLAREKNSEEIREIHNGVNRELFCDDSSPIFKIPVVPEVKQIPVPCSSVSLELLNSTDNDEFVCKEETVLPAKSLRRSRRLSTRAQSLSSNNDSVIVPKRRSTRLSSKSFNDARRRSIRLLSHKEQSFEEDQEKPNTSATETDKPTTSKAAQKSKKTACSLNENPTIAATQTEKPTTLKAAHKSKKVACSLVENPTIAGYFEKQENNKSINLKSNLAKHQKAILEMLNSASMKELQYLPQIGLKTAFQIVTQRTLRGKFKNFTQVSKLPIWRGKGWERFKEANSISG